MAITDQRLTVLQIINEVREKVKLNPVTTVTGDKDSLVKLKYLNDVIDEVSDYGNWQESLTSITVTAVSSTADYSLSSQLETQASAVVVQNIHEIVWDTDTGEMNKIDLDDLRRLQRLSSSGNPQQWAIKGVDSSGNPKFGVHPMPVSAQAGKNFTVWLHTKPAFLVTADGGTRPPFPGKLLVQGLLAKTVLDESDGEPTARYMQVKSTYDNMVGEAYNRYNGDTGSHIFFRPGRGGR